MQVAARCRPRSVHRVRFPTREKRTTGGLWSLNSPSIRCLFVLSTASPIPFLSSPTRFMGTIPAITRTAALEEYYWRVLSFHGFYPPFISESECVHPDICSIVYIIIFLFRGVCFVRIAFKMSGSVLLRKPPYFPLLSQ